MTEALFFTVWIVGTPIIITGMMVAQRLGFNIIDPTDTESGLHILGYGLVIMLWPLVAFAFAAFISIAAPLSILWFISGFIANAIMKMFPERWKKVESESHE